MVVLANKTFHIYSEETLGDLTFGNEAILYGGKQLLAFYCGFQMELLQCIVLKCVYRQI